MTVELMLTAARFPLLEPTVYKCYSQPFWGDDHCLITLEFLKPSPPCVWSGFDLSEHARFIHAENDNVCPYSDMEELVHLLKLGQFGTEQSQTNQKKGTDAKYLPQSFSQNFALPRSVGLE